MHKSFIMVRLSENDCEKVGIGGRDFRRAMGMSPSDVVFWDRECRGWDFANRCKSRVLVENSESLLKDVEEGREV